MAKTRGVYFMAQPGLFNPMPDRAWPKRRFATLFIEIDPGTKVIDVFTPLFAVLQDRYETCLWWAVTPLRYDNRLQQELAQRKLRAGDLFDPPPPGLARLTPDAQTVIDIRGTAAEVVGPLSAELLADLAGPDSLIVFAPIEMTARELAATLRAFAEEAVEEEGLSTELISSILNAHHDWIILRVGEQCLHWDTQIAGARKVVHGLANVLHEKGFQRFTDPFDFIAAAAGDA